MKLIPLTQGQFAKVDDEWFDYLNQWKWHARKSSLTFYARRKYYRNGKDNCILMHRLISDCPKGLTVDHLDHDGLNNQYDNLKNCSQQENNVNRRALFCKRNTSGYGGVSWNKFENKWIAQVRRYKKQMHLGYFKTKEEAILRMDLFNRFGL